MLRTMKLWPRKVPGGGENRPGPWRPGQLEGHASARLCCPLTDRVLALVASAGRMRRPKLQSSPSAESSPGRGARAVVRCARLSAEKPSSAGSALGLGAAARGAYRRCDARAPCGSGIEASTARETTLVPALVVLDARGPGVRAVAPVRAENARSAQRERRHPVPAVSAGWWRPCSEVSVGVALQGGPTLNFSSTPRPQSGVASR